MFTSNNCASFHLWWKGNSLKHQKASNCYENDCDLCLVNVPIPYPPKAPDNHMLPGISSWHKLVTSSTKWNHQWSAQIWPMLHSTPSRNTKNQRLSSIFRGTQNRKIGMKRVTWQDKNRRITASKKKGSTRAV